jgi:hypothetical protein
MKKYLFITVLSLCLLAVVGCDKPYLPAAFASDLDYRIVEDKAALKLTTDATCQEFISADLDFLLQLRAASK